MPEEADPIDPADDSAGFAQPIGTGMEPVPPGAGAEFSAATVERLRNRLDQFDAVRTRGEVESRSAHLGGQSPR
jgi:hypothetical protein